jgi:hypothetical protein
MQFDGFNRQELVQLLLQSLGDLGLERTRATLQEESGVTLETEGVASLRQAVARHDWSQALQDAQHLEIDAGRLKALRFHLLEQRLLEEIASHLRSSANDAKDIFEQTAELCQELSQAAFDAASNERANRVSQYLSCRTLEAFEQASGWSSQEGMRQVLWDQLASFLPPGQTVPPRRLSVLLWQAVRYQQLHCLYRDVDEQSNPASLLQDYKYELPPLPTRCIAELDHHSDEARGKTRTETIMSTQR